jgi:WD40 repeat protein
MMMNPVSQTKSSPEAVDYVGTTIQWYWEQAARVFDSQEGDGDKTTLYSSFVNLYEQILQFQMGSICDYYRTRGSVLLRDGLKLDNGEEMFKSIQQADDVLREEIKAFLVLESEPQLLNSHTKVQERYYLTKEDQQCLRDLRITDPRADRIRIEDTQGGLLQESYQWILENPQFKTWRDSNENSLIWLRGDPGIGKTMLLCGLVQELMQQSAPCLVTYFFCQATIPTINNHIAVLRGLMWLLAEQRPSLISHIRKAYDAAGMSVFDEGNAWDTLSNIFRNMLADDDLPPVCIIIDALDECTTGVAELLDFIQEASSLPNVKWMVSSRNRTDVEEKMHQGTCLSLEINATLVKAAVEAYISQKMSQMPFLNQEYELRREVCRRMEEKANGSFLWVAIVIQALNSRSYAHCDGISEMLDLLDQMPEDLSKLREIMLQQIFQLEGRDPELCRAILATVTLAHRPLHLDELSCLVGFEGDPRRLPHVTELVNVCGSFLTIREDVVYFIHQSAKDYLSGPSPRPVIFPLGEDKIHHNMVTHSLNAMARTLQEDIYRLGHLGILIDEISPPNPSPLRRVLYSCTYWAAHICQVASRRDKSLFDDEKVLGFFKAHFLHWLEALSLTRNLPSNIGHIKRLSELLKVNQARLAYRQQTPARDELQAFVRDASRFLQYHAHIMENAPLQIYVSALLFSPTESLIRTCCDGKLSAWILMSPNVGRVWSPCLHVVEANESTTMDSSGTTLLIMNKKSRDVEIWDIATGRRSQVLSHAETVHYARFLRDSGRILTFTERLSSSWDAVSGALISVSSIHDLHLDWRTVSVSEDGRLVASRTRDGVQICDLVERTVEKKTLRGREGEGQLRWSNNAKFLASGGIIMRNSGATGGMRKMKLTDPFPSNPWMATFSSDSKLVAMVDQRAVAIWDLDSRERMLTLQANNVERFLLAEFSPDGGLIAASCTLIYIGEGGAQVVKIWDTATGQIQHQLRWGWSNFTRGLRWLNGMRALAVASYKAVGVYDLSERTFWSSGGHDGRTYFPFKQLICSADLTRVAVLYDSDIDIWDTTTGIRIQTFRSVSQVATEYAFSPDLQSLQGYHDYGCRVWDFASGSEIETTGWCPELPAQGTTCLRYRSSSDLPRQWQNHRAGTSVSLRCFSNNADYLALMLEKNQFEIRSVVSREMIWTTDDDGSWAHGDEGDGCETCFRPYYTNTSIAVSDDGERVLFTQPHHQRMWVLARGRERISLRMCNGDFKPCFDVESPYILTQCGSIHLDKLIAQANDLQSAHDYQRLTEGYGLTYDGSWVTWNGQNIIWLPPGYRLRGKRVISQTCFVLQMLDSAEPFIIRFSGPPPFRLRY